MTLHNRMTGVKTTNPYFLKDLAKSELATKFIGQGSAASSTNKYMLAAGDLANCGNYTASDKIFVSVEGARVNRIALNLAEIDLAIRAGSTFVADVSRDRMRSYNVGERELAVHLASSSYTEITPGVWVPLNKKEIIMARSFHKNGTIPLNQVFVFGSNLAGRHGKGSALAAKENFGAIYGQGQGRQGNAYAIPTKDGRPGTPTLSNVTATLSLDDIRRSVDVFIQYAIQHAEERFFVVRLGCDLAAHKDADIAPMFSKAPSNCSFPEEWASYLSGQHSQEIKPTTKVRRFPKNKHGRDFILGDIHGAYDLVWAAMKEAKFDPKCDRLFAVGDLVDRGEESYRCVQFLKQHYVHAISGNHEIMLIDLYASGAPDVEIIEALSNMNYNGMRWLGKITAEQRQEVVDAIRQLPLVIEIETDRGTVGLVHADVPQGMEWSVFLDKIESDDKATIDFALGLSDNSRDRIRTNRMDGVAGVGRVFVGHTPLFGGVRQFGNLYAVDCGGCFGAAGKKQGAHLAMANAVMSTGLLMAPREPSSNPLIDVRHPNDAPTKPFFNIADLI